MKEIFFESSFGGWSVKLAPVVGSFIVKDGKEPIGEELLPCDDWDKAEFRWPNPIPEWRENHATAVNVEITGRTLQRIPWHEGSDWIRVKLTWLTDDGEPNKTSGGWLWVTGKEEIK